MIPDKLVVENKTVYYVEGWIFGSSLVKDICILYDGNKFPATDHSIYRPDVLTAYYRIDKKTKLIILRFSHPCNYTTCINRRKKVHTIDRKI